MSFAHLGIGVVVDDLVHGVVGCRDGCSSAYEGAFVVLLPSPSRATLLLLCVFSGGSEVGSCGW